MTVSWTKINSKTTLESLCKLVDSDASFLLSCHHESSYLLLAQSLQRSLEDRTGVFLAILAQNLRQKTNIQRSLQRLSKKHGVDFAQKLIVFSLSELEEMRQFHEAEIREKMPFCIRIVLFADEQYWHCEASTLARYFLYELFVQYKIPHSIVGAYSKNAEWYAKNLSLNEFYFVDEAVNKFDLSIIYAKEDSDCFSHIAAQTHKRKFVLCTNNLQESELIAQDSHKRRAKVSLLFNTGEEPARPVKSREYFTSYHCRHATAAMFCDKRLSGLVLVNPEINADIYSQANLLLPPDAKLAVITRDVDSFFAAIVNMDRIHKRVDFARKQWCALCYILLARLHAKSDFAALCAQILAAPAFSQHSQEEIDAIISQCCAAGYLDAWQNSYRLTPKLYALYRELPSLGQALNLLDDSAYLCRDPNGLSKHFLSANFVQCPSSAHYRLGNSYYERKITQHINKIAISANINNIPHQVSLFQSSQCFNFEQAQRVAKLLCDSKEDRKYRFSRSAKRQLHALRSHMEDVLEHLALFLEYNDEQVQLWTFAGARLNACICFGIMKLAPKADVLVGNFSVLVRGLPIIHEELMALPRRILEILKQDEYRLELIKTFSKDKAAYFFEQLLLGLEHMNVSEDLDAAIQVLSQNAKFNVVPVAEMHALGEMAKFAPKPEELKAKKIKCPEKYSFNGLCSGSSPKFVGDPKQMMTQNPWFYIETAHDLRHCLNKLLKQSHIGLDVETTLYKQSLCLIQIATATKTFILDPLALDVRALGQVFENPNIVKIIHNASFEKAVLKSIGISIYNIADTLTLSRRRYGMKAEGGHSLKAVCYREFGKIMDKRCQTSDWQKRPLSPEQLEYAALDAEILVRIYQKFTDKLV
ncbi:MAG: ribonuclease D [Bradymonadales bacterium]